VQPGDFKVVEHDGRFWRPPECCGIEDFETSADASALDDDQLSSWPRLAGSLESGD
jgi:hypothetical protein